MLGTQGEDPLSLLSSCFPFGKEVKGPEGSCLLSSLMPAASCHGLSLAPAGVPGVPPTSTKSYRAESPLRVCLPACERVSFSKSCSLGASRGCSQKGVPGDGEGGFPGPLGILPASGFQGLIVTPLPCTQGPGAWLPGVEIQVRSLQAASEGMELGGCVGRSAAGAGVYVLPPAPGLDGCTDSSVCLQGTFSQKGKNLSEGLASLAKQGMWLSLPSELSPNQTIWIQPLSEDLKENVGD